MGCRGVTVEVPDLKRQLNCYRIYGCCSTPVHCLTLPFCHHSHHKVPSFLTPPPLSQLKIKKKKEEKGRILYITSIFITSLWIHSFHQCPETKKMLTEPAPALIMYKCVSMNVLYSLFVIFYIPLLMCIPCFQ